MRHHDHNRKFGRKRNVRLAFLRSLTRNLLEHERIRTSEARAKEIRPIVEKLITLGKRGDLHAWRLATTRMYDEKVVDKLFHIIAPRYTERAGGYTRVIKLGPRQGDAAPMAQIELVE